MLKINRKTMSRLLTYAMMDYYVSPWMKHGDWIGCTELEAEKYIRKADLYFLRKDGIAHEIEVKVDISDLMNDKKKRCYELEKDTKGNFLVSIYESIPHYRFFAVPLELWERHRKKIEEECISRKWGLYVIQIFVGETPFRISENSPFDIQKKIRPKLLISKEVSRENMRWTIERRMSRMIRTFFQLSALKQIRIDTTRNGEHR